MRQSVMPLVSIGVPVYNGGAELRRALETLLAQTHSNLELVISDNASTDETEATCREFAARDPRVVYYRNETNLGPGANFEKVLRVARGEFFMWAAHDDWWHPRFVEANLANLLTNPTVIGSISKVVFADSGRHIHLRPWVPSGTSPLLSSVRVNIRRYVRDPGMNTRFYSLFQRNILIQCTPLANYPGGDWTFIVQTLAYGKYAEVPLPMYGRGVRGASSNPLRTLESSSWGVRRWLPMWSFTQDVLKMPHVRIDLGLCLSLAYINLVYALVLMKARLLHSVAGRGR